MQRLSGFQTHMLVLAWLAFYASANRHGCKTRHRLTHLLLEPLIMRHLATLILTLLAIIAVGISAPVNAQVAPTPQQVATYEGLLKAAHENDLATIDRLISEGADLEQRDGRQRTAFIIAGFAGHHEAMVRLAKAGAEVNTLEAGIYDVVTIAAVANDLPTMDLALSLGNRADNITSRYDGTALITAAHLGHHAVVKRLIKAGAPLDHINNLNWTALIEAVVLGDGGPNHQKTARLLVEAGADKSITDRDGRTPLILAKRKGYDEIVKILETQK